MTQLQIAVVRENLTLSEEVAIEEYTTMEYEVVNSILRGYMAPDEATMNYIQELDSALTKIPSTGPDILLSRVETYYRKGTQDRVEFLKSLKAGDTYSDDGFMSMTSLIIKGFNIREVVDDDVLGIPSIAYFRSTASKERKTIVIFNYRGNQAKNITKYSHLEEENEHLMPRGSKTTVKSVKTTAMEDGAELLEIELGD